MGPPPSLGFLDFDSEVIALFLSLNSRDTLRAFLGLSTLVVRFGGSASEKAAFVFPKDSFCESFELAYAETGDVVLVLTSHFWVPSSSSALEEMELFALDAQVLLPTETGT